MACVTVIVAFGVLTGREGAAAGSDAHETTAHRTAGGTLLAGNAGSARGNSAAQCRGVRDDLRCAERLRLDVDATLAENRENEPSTVHVRVSDLELRRRADGTFAGEGTLEVVRYEVAPFDCWTHTYSVTQTKSLRVSSLRITGGLQAPTLRLALDAGALRERITHSCAGGTGEPVIDERNTYREAMATVLPGEVTGWRTRPFKPATGTGRVLATRTLTRAASDVWSGTVTFTLREYARECGCGACPVRSTMRKADAFMRLASSRSGSRSEVTKADIAAVRKRLEVLGKSSPITRAQGGATFQRAVREFRAEITRQWLTGRPRRAGLEIALHALALWATDDGNTWGQGLLDSRPLPMTAPEYAVVPANQYKCNAYVAEVIHRATGLVFKVYQSTEEPGRWFPYRAADWHNSNVAIPAYAVVFAAARLGDIVATPTHVGIYLGKYNDKHLYISARDVFFSEEMFGIGVVQHRHGIQIKYAPGVATYRRYYTG